MKAQPVPMSAMVMNRRAPFKLKRKDETDTKGSHSVGDSLLLTLGFHVLLAKDRGPISGNLPSVSNTSH